MTTPLTLTLNPGDRHTYTEDSDQYTFDSLTLDIIHGRIHHAAPTTGKGITLLNNGDGTVTLCATIEGDYDGSGTVNVDDAQLAVEARVRCGPDFLHKIG